MTWNPEFLTRLTDGLASPASWLTLLGKPSTFPPSTHTHAQSQVTNLEADLAAKADILDLQPVALSGLWADIQEKPATFPAAAHTHAWVDVTGKPTTFAPAAHTHTQGDVTGLTTALAGKADTGHTHAWVDITGKPTTFTPAAHTHALADINATGVRDATTFLRGDGTFAAPPAGGASKTTVQRASANIALAAATTVQAAALDFALAANETVVLYYTIYVTVTAGTVGLKPVFTLPAGATGVAHYAGRTTAAASSEITTTALGTASTLAFLTAAQTATIVIEATVTNGATPGTCRLGLATGASAAGNILAGSSVQINRV